MSRIITNVVVTVALMASSAGYADTYNPSTNQLTIQAVTVGATTYTDVIVTVGNVLNVGGSYPAGATTFPLASAMNAFAHASHNYTLTGAYNGKNDSMQVNFTPGALSTFEGQAASTLSESITLTQNGAVTYTESDISYFASSPYLPLGGVVLGSGQYLVDSNQQALPTSATVGQGGSYATLTTYTNNTKSSVYSTETQTWSLLADTATTAWLCINTSGSTAVTGSACYKVNTTGSILAMKLTLALNGASVTLQ